MQSSTILFILPKCPKGKGKVSEFSLMKMGFKSGLSRVERTRGAQQAEGLGDTWAGDSCGTGQKLVCREGWCKV